MEGRISVGAANNDLLAGMPREDRERLWPALRREPIPARTYLERRGLLPDNVYFIETGVVSILETGDIRDPLEVGVVGNEGMVGASTIVGHLVPQRDSYVQIEGQALVLGRLDFQAVLASSTTLPRYLLRYLQTQIVQLSLAVSASVRANLQQRLARKLLMYHDRIGADDLPLTHENMSIMLGVRRASITHTVHNLEAEGWIKAQRGLISIRDRGGLQDYCGPFYGVAEARYRDIMSQPVDYMPPPSPPPYSLCQSDPRRSA